MGKGRASVFADTDDAAIDISEFAPKPAAAPAPTQAQVKTVSEAVNFPSRETAKPSGKVPRKPRRYRTGRNVQFNAKRYREPWTGSTLCVTRLDGLWAIPWNVLWMPWSVNSSPRCPGRGRDTGCPIPPHRSPRAALPHEALILDEWRQSGC
jgi:hypothetical protein